MFQEPVRPKLAPAPIAPVSPQVQERPALECRVRLGKALASLTLPEARESALVTCYQHAKIFEETWGFSLPALVFEESSSLPDRQFSIWLRGEEIYRGGVGASQDTLEVVASALCQMPWRLFTYESFRFRLIELEKQEPFLVEAVTSRMDLVLVWQALQTLLRNRGNLKGLSAKLERLLVESTGPAEHVRERLLSPRSLVGNPLDTVELLDFLQKA